MHVGHVVPILDGVEAEFVGRAVDDAAFDAAAGHPDAEAVRMMVAAVAVLRAGRAAELGGPDDQRLVQQAALLEILQQRRRSADRSAAELGVVGLQAAVRSQPPAPPLEP